MLTILQKISDNPVPVYQFTHGEVEFQIAIVGQFLHEYHDGTPKERLKCLQNGVDFKMYRKLVNTVKAGYFVFALDKNENRVVYVKENPNSPFELMRNTTNPQYAPQ